MSISRLLHGFFSTGASNTARMIGYGASALGDATSLVLTVMRSQKYEYDVLATSIPAGIFVLATLGFLYKSAGRTGNLPATEVADAGLSFIGTTIYSAFRFTLDLSFANQRNYTETNHELFDGERRLAIYEDALELSYDVCNLLEPAFVLCAMACVRRFCAEYANAHQDESLLSADQSRESTAPTM